MELKLLKALFDKKSYDRFGSFINKKHFTTDASYCIMENLRDYYDKHEEPISVSELKVIIDAALSAASPMWREDVMTVLSDLEKEEVTEPAEAYLEAIEKQSIVGSAMSLYEQGDLEGAIDKFGELSNLPVKQKHNFDSFDVDEMKAELEKSDKYKWMVPKLNEIMTGFGDESSLLVCARPDTGKTSFMVANAVSMMRGGAKVMYLSISEDTQAKLRQRFIQAALGVNNTEYYNELEYLVDTFKDEFTGKLFLRNVSSLSLMEVEALVASARPDIVFYDQYQKVSVKHNAEARSDEVLTRVVQGLKGLAKDYKHGIVCGTQAAATAEQNNFQGNKHKRIVGLNDISGSKTGVPGEFQTIIGIGQDDDAAAQFYTDGDQQFSVSWKHFHVAKSKEGFNGEKFQLALAADRCQWFEV